MAVPKRRTGKGRRDRRRSHHRLTAVMRMSCSHCGSTKLPHRACPNCGYYNGRFVFQPKT
ncbi:50S ribosomal protein L32 [bacterium]|nr:50S ribosomal protein L32 [bacterium]